MLTLGTALTRPYARFGAVALVNLATVLDDGWSRPFAGITDLGPRRS